MVEVMLKPAHVRSVFVRIQAPTHDGRRWRLGTQHQVALVAYFARLWGPVDSFEFERVRAR